MRNDVARHRPRALACQPLSRSWQTHALAARGKMLHYARAECPRLLHVHQDTHAKLCQPKHRVCLYGAFARSCAYSDTALFIVGVEVRG